MDFGLLAQECAPQVAHQTMAAIVKTESAFRPLAIGINGKVRLARQPESKEEAVVTAKWLIKLGYNIDMGLGQINSANLPKLGITVDDVFEPCKNLAASARILQGNYQAAKGKGQGEQAALLAALSAYNTGSFSKGFTNGYVQNVARNAGVEITNTPGIKATPIPLKKTGETQLAKHRSKAEVKTAKHQKKEQGDGALESMEASMASPTTPNVMVY